MFAVIEIRKQTDFRIVGILADIFGQTVGDPETFRLGILIQRAVKPGGGNRRTVIQGIQRNENAVFPHRPVLIEECAETGPARRQQHITLRRDLPDKIQEPVQMRDHFLEHLPVTGMVPMVFQPQDPQLGRIRRIGINPGRHDLHDHAVFQLGLGKIPDRPVDDPGPAEQEMQCPRIDIRFRQSLTAPAAGIVDDVLVHAAAQRGKRKFPHFIADLVRAGKIAAAAEFRGGGGEAQHRNDRTRGFPHRDHDISGSARHQPHPGIVPVLQDQGIGHPAQRADGPHRIAGEMQPAGDVHDIPRGTVQVQDREPVAEFLQVIDCELALMQPRDPTLPFHGEFAIRKEG